MSKKTLRVQPELQAWIEARMRHRLSHAQIQMARELGMNPKKIGKLDNHDQEPWKAPLPLFIEHLYEKRFGRSRPERVLCVEEVARERQRKQEEKKQRKRERIAKLNDTVEPSDRSDQTNGRPGALIARVNCTPHRDSRRMGGSRTRDAADCAVFPCFHTYEEELPNA